MTPSSTERGWRQKVICSIQASGRGGEEALCLETHAHASLHLLAVTGLGEPVSWIAPLGLPVVQPYKESRLREVRTSLQKVYLVEESAEEKIHRQKQLTAFPPNFVHSLDSSHMLMTAIACDDAGITFTAVHDSYWTHAGDVVQMNELLREEFIVLHQKNLLGDLLSELRSRYPQARDQFTEVPPTGQLNLNEVRKSKCKHIANRSPAPLAERLGEAV